MAINVDSDSNDAVEIGYGGTGSQLTDPGADRILFWDDSAAAGSNTTWLAPGNGLSITATTLNVTWPVAFTSDYSSDFDAAAVAIGATPTTLYVNDASTMSTNVTAPATCAVIILKGGSIDQAGNTLTFNGPLVVQGGTITNDAALTINGSFPDPGSQQIFTDTGAVTFGSGSAESVNPLWWLPNTDPGTTDMGAAFTAAGVAVSGTGIAINVPAGTYYATTEIDASTSNFKLIGAGQGSTTINYDGSDYFVNGGVPDAARYYPEIRRMTITCGATALGAIKFGDPAEAYSGDKWYYGAIFKDLTLTGSSLASSYGFNLTQLMRATFDNLWVLSFATNFGMKHVSESKVGNIRTGAAVDYTFDISMTTSTPSPSSDMTAYNNIALSGLADGQTAIRIVTTQNLSFNNLFFEDTVSHGVTALFDITDSAMINIKNVDISVTDATTEFFDLTDPRDMTIENVRYADINIIPATGSVAIAYTNPRMGYYYEWGVRVINCHDNINQLFAPFWGVSILSSGISPGGLHNYNRPITGINGLFARQVLNRQGVTTFPESSYVFSAWSGGRHFVSGVSSIIADADCGGGYGFSIPSGSYLGPAFAYPSEISTGKYEVIVRMKSTAGTPVANIGLIVDAVGFVRYVSPTISTTMSTYSWKINLVAGDIGAGTLVAFALTHADTVIVDYFAVRQLFNDIVITDYTAPTTNYSEASSGHRIIFAAAAPAAGVWNQGDVCFNSEAATAAASGWVCTVSGTPGTWKAMANLP